MRDRRASTAAIVVCAAAMKGCQLMTNSLTLTSLDRTPFADGKEFGNSGPYERIAGRARFAVDPTSKAQASIVDLDKAPRDARGLVHLAADFMLLKPVDMARGNR